MFVMTEPIAGETVASISGEPAAQAVLPPQQKPEAMTKPIATASAKPAPTATPTKPSGQAAPAPQDVDAAPADADSATVSQAATAEAAMAESAPLTRRQKRLMRKQQQEPDPFLPWLR
jgi:hypothetical protein